MQPAPLGADPQAALRVLEERRDDRVPQARGIASTMGEIAEGLPRVLQQVGSRQVGADPELAVGVLVQSAHHVLAEGERVRGLVDQGHEAAAGGVVALYPRAVGPHPDAARPPDQHAREAIGAQAAGISEMMPQLAEAPAGSVPHAEPSTVGHHPQVSRGVFGNAVDRVVPQAGGIVPGVTMVHEALWTATRRAVTLVQARVAGADPQPAAAVEEQRRDRVAPQALGIFGPPLVTDDSAGFGVDLEQAVPFGAHPQRPVGRLGDRRHSLPDPLDRDEGLRPPVEAAQAAPGAHPQALPPVFVEHGDRVVGNAARIRGIVLEHHEGVAVEAVEPLLRAEPQKAHVVLEDRLDGALGEPLLEGEAGKARGGRGWKRCGR
jgi:hypothetical protein